MALTELFKRIRGYEVDEANSVRVHSSNVRGFAHLPITVRPAEGPAACPVSPRFPTADPPSSPAPPPASVRPPRSSSPRAAFRSRWAPAGWRSSTTSSARSAPTAARPCGFHLDVTDPNSVKAFVRADAVDALGEIEVLVAGAGDTYFGKLADISTEDFDSQIQIHLVGANRLAGAVLPGMIERQRGDLIFVGSDVALRQRPHMGAYGAAKAALVAMVDQLPDGTRGHRRARVDRASRPDQDVDGLEPARRV